MDMQGDGSQSYREPWVRALCVSRGLCELALRSAACRARASAALEACASSACFSAVLRALRSASSTASFFSSATCGRSKPQSQVQS